VWEYRELAVPAGQSVTDLLNGAGAEGWETTGLQFSSASGLVLVLKRTR
jgi:hypothetical protein